MHMILEVRRVIWSKAQWKELRNVLRSNRHIGAEMRAQRAAIALHQDVEISDMNCWCSAIVRLPHSLNNPARLCAHQGVEPPDRCCGCLGRGSRDPPQSRKPSPPPSAQ